MTQLPISRVQGINVEIEFLQRELASLRRQLPFAIRPKDEEPLLRKIKGIDLEIKRLYASIGMGDWGNHKDNRKARNSTRAKATRDYKARMKAVSGTLSCEVCGWTAPPGYGDVLNVHHIVPVSCDGTDDDGNLIALCPNCHALADRAGMRRKEGWVAPSTRAELLEILKRTA